MNRWAALLGAVVLMAATVVYAQTGAMSDDKMKSDRMTMDHMKMMSDNMKMMSDRMKGGKMTADQMQMMSDRPSCGGFPPAPRSLVTTVSRAGVRSRSGRA
jgi:hypothetical protein